jgi:hypothetical protein
MKNSTAIILFALAVVTHDGVAQTRSFGSGDNAFSIDFVQIGNPNNQADTSGGPSSAGAVAYEYLIGKYEISREMIDKANAASFLGIAMYDMTSFGGNDANKPATGINKYDAARFVNYLNTSTGGFAAYKFDSNGNFQLWDSNDAGYSATNPFRNTRAKYVLPTTDEWYKAAFGSPNGDWYRYATGKNILSQDDAVYNASGPADITNAGVLSPYGTMAQSGNVWEWTESTYDGLNDDSNKPMEVRGGGWDYNTENFGNGILDHQNRSYNYADYDAYNVGFRVASLATAAAVPEPSAFSLLAVGLGALAMMRRRRV